MKEKLVLARNILLSNIKRLSSPYKITFSITNKCNSKCKTCNIWKKETGDELSLHELEEVFSKTSNISWLDITGGEIFLRQDIKKIFEAINENCDNLYLLHFPTNGVLTDKIVSISKEINEYDIPKFIVSVSLDGPKALHDKIRGVEGSFKRAIATYNGLKKTGVEVYFGMTLSQHNAGQLEETLEALKDKATGFKKEDIHISLYHQSDHYYSNQDMDLKEIQKDIELARKIKGISLDPVQYLEQKFLNGASDYIQKCEMAVKCEALQSSCFINSKGKVFPCVVYDQEVGSLRDNNYDLNKVWNSKEAKQAIEKIRDLECGGCWTACESYQGILGNLLYFFNLR